MTAEKPKQCKECGEFFHVNDLSSKGHCYECAKRRMIEAFDRMWRLSHKRGGPGWSGESTHSVR